MADGNQQGAAAAQGAVAGGTAGASLGPVGAGIGAGVGALGGFLGGKGGQQVESGLTLPPALEAEMLKRSSQELQNLGSYIDQIGSVIDTYNTRINTIQQGLEGTIPSTELQRQLTENSANLALRLGANADELVANGFLDQDDIKRIEELDTIRSQEFVDQAFEQEFSQQRQALEQQLMRDGQSRAEIAQTLAVFDSQKAVERQQRGDILQQGAFQRGLAALSAQQGSRQLGFGLAQGALSAQQGILQNVQGVYGTMANMQTGAAQLGMAGIQNQAGLGQLQQGLFNQLGQFKFSGQTKSMLKNDGAFGYGDPTQAAYESFTDSQLMQAYSDAKNRYESGYGTKNLKRNARDLGVLQAEVDRRKI